MPSYLDLGLLGVVLISALLAMLRGFTREVLAIASWGAAAIAAIYLHPLLLPYVKPYISKDVVAMKWSVPTVCLRRRTPRRDVASQRPKNTVSR